MLKYLAESFLSLLFPPRCPVCEHILSSGEHLICRSCAGELPFVPAPRCMKCGKPIRDFQKEYCSDCEMHPHGFDEGRAVFLYAGGVRRAIDRLKFYNRREYVPFFAAALSTSAREVFPKWKPDCLIPVPMHPKKRAERGFDQAELLAAELSKLRGIPLRKDLLMRTRYTRASKKLGREKRKQNMRGVFAVRQDVKLPDSAVLVDDIYTTGTTMDEAASALRRAGVRRVFFLCVCIGEGDD